MFGPGAATPSDTIRTFGVHRDGNSDKSSGMELKVSTPDHEEIAVSSASTTKPDETNGCFADATDDSAQIRKRYKEPWVKKISIHLCFSLSLSLSPSLCHTLAI